MRLSMKESACTSSASRGTRDFPENEAGSANNAVSGGRRTDRRRIAVSGRQSPTGRERPPTRPPLRTCPETELPNSTRAACRPQASTNTDSRGCACHRVKMPPPVRFRMRHASRGRHTDRLDGNVSDSLSPRVACAFDRSTFTERESVLVQSLCASDAARLAGVTRRPTRLLWLWPQATPYLRVVSHPGRDPVPPRPAAARSPSSPFVYTLLSISD